MVEERNDLVPSPNFADSLELFGDAPALITEDGVRISYADLAARADAFAARLGPAPRLLAIEADNSVEAIVAYLGALRSRHPVILLAANAGDRTANILRTYRPDAIYARRQEAFELALAAPEGGLHPDLALMLSTSGTTGAVKLVRLSIGAIASNADSIRTYLGIGPDERAITSLPIHYSYGLSVLNSHLASGAALLVTARSAVEPEFWAFFRREGGTSFAGVPHSYEMLERSGFRTMDLPSLRTLTQAGGRMPPDMVATFGGWARGRGVRLFVMYGQTEATARMAYMPPDRLLDHPDCIGVPIPNGRFALIDEAGASIEGSGRTGELVYRGPNVMMSYALERGDLARGAEIDALHTGDLAERTAEGLFRIVGRKNRFCKPFGLRVSLDEIEALLRRDGIAGMATGTDDMIAIGYVEGPGTGEIAQRLSDALELPASLFEPIRLAAFPTLPSGKPDYQAVLRLAHERRAEDTERGQDAGFAPALAAVLNRRTVNADDSFNSLEGDSLSYVAAASLIEERLGYLPDGWESMPVSALDALVPSPDAGRVGWLRPIQSEVLLRAMAILAVVLTHVRASLHMAGGSDLLLLLAGFSFVRFDLSRVVGSGAWTVVRRFFVRVVAPYYAILLVYALVRPGPAWPTFLLLGNFVGVFGKLITVYWFIEALFQMLVVTAVLFSLRPVRRAAEASPFVFFCGFFLAAMAVRIAAFQLFHHAYLLNRTPDFTFPFFALGGAIYLARGLGQRLICMAFAVILAVATSGLGQISDWFGGWPLAIGAPRAVWTVAGAALLLFLPRIKLPSVLARGVVAVAGISFTIYLTHAIAIYFVLEWAHMGSLPAYVAALILPVLVTAAIRLARRFRFQGRSADVLEPAL